MLHSISAFDTISNEVQDLNTSYISDIQVFKHQQVENPQKLQVCSCLKYACGLLIGMCYDSREGDMKDTVEGKSTPDSRELLHSLNS